MKNLRIIISVVSLLSAVGICGARQSDSAAFVSASWQTRNVADGIEYSQARFEGNLFESNQIISVLTIASGHRFDIIEVSGETLQKTTKIAADAGARVAVNGSFFRMRNPFGAVTYTRVDGETVGENTNESKLERWQRGSRQSGSIAIFKGDFYIVKADELQSWERLIEAEDVLTSGPLLLIGGERHPQVENSFNKTRHPRTVVGKRADGTAVLVVVDGRHKEAKGMSTWELQQIMEWLGCESALNLDGGGSSTMVVDGEIVNYPCDNKTLDHLGERSVANALIVR